MAYSAYDAILSVRESTPTLSYKAHMQAIINSQFDRASNYYIVQLKDRYTGLYSDIGVRIDGWYAQNSTEKIVHDDLKKITFKDCDQSIDLGDIFQFNNYRWMVVSTDVVSGVTKSCGVQRCNLQLKFVDSTLDVMPTITDTVLVVDAIADVNIYIPLEDRYVLLPANQMSVKVPNDATTIKIKDAPRGTRFLCGSPVKGWRVIGIDNVTQIRDNLDATPLRTGIISLIMKSESVNKSLDNVTERVAKQM